MLNELVQRFKIQLKEDGKNVNVKIMATEMVRIMVIMEKAITKVIMVST
ncbi:hypothetical protein [Clostridium fungisolvens]|uniref:Uncharacterized protein n=1 Tax=Clostridium fungisolvens TaxID=1604897 RepID=A0A6V8ST50_9CLOT|nr:hypothetical protein [Clostridium fungisolvens]GFP78428.1 hypothetical protein bsdtw1_04652 [Clostridium fungisolvens]